MVSLVALPLAPAGLGTAPFGGVSRRMPGVVEAEDFDEGEAGVTVHDVTSRLRGPLQWERKGDRIEVKTPPVNRVDAVILR